MKLAKRHVGKVIFVKIPGHQRPAWRWITKKRLDGRFLVRTPKRGVLIRDLDKKRESDFGKEHLLPLGASAYEAF